MNHLDAIRTFVNSQVPENRLVNSEPVDHGKMYLTALECLIQSNDWLADRPLTERVISLLEALEPQTTEERSRTAAVYMKIINLCDQPVPLRTVQIQISQDTAINLPTKLLAAESRVFEDLCNRQPYHPINLSDEASSETLAHIITYLTTGRTDFVCIENAVEILLLANKYELKELSIKCLIPAFTSSVKNVGIRGRSKEEVDLRMLLNQSSECFIIPLSSDSDGIAIAMNNGLRQEFWDCLKRIHQLAPIKHLELSGDRNLDFLVDFATYNPGIISLNLGVCEDLTDEHLDKLAPHLTQLKSLSIHSASITAIPKSISDRLINLDCSNTSHLTSIDTPKATTLVCSMGKAITGVNAPRATRIDCSFCSSLISLVATRAETLYCTHSALIINIEAPNASLLDCSDCGNLNSIIAPKAQGLDCVQCPALTSIDASNVRELNCSKCPKVKSIVAPHAIRLNCSDCYSLESITAPNVRELNCRYSFSLESITAPNVNDLNCAYCKALPGAVKLQLFNTVRRNIIKTHYTNPAGLSQAFLQLLNSAGVVYGLNDSNDATLNQWFLDSLELTIPADFDSPEAKLICEQKIDSLLDRLYAIAATNDIFQGCDLSWFTNLKQLHGLQQRANQMAWLGRLMVCTAAGEHPLNDLQAVPSLIEIGNHIDPFIQAGATCAVLSLYDDQSSAHKELWKSLMENQPDHLLLPSLFLACGNIKADIAKKVMGKLQARYYRSKKLLNPIIQTAYMLSQEHILSSSEREALLTLILDAPEKGVRENAKVFKTRTEKYRSAQIAWVTACRDLLLFSKGLVLKDVQTVDELVAAHKNACREIFGVEEGLVQPFTEAFKSKRYPGGLFTYAARLQTLPAEEKQVITELLGRFVNGILKGQYPNNRYDLSGNPHLKTIFRNNERLLEMWKEPFEIALAQGEKSPLDRQGAPINIAKSIMKMAIENRHLGEDQDKLYPSLARAVASEDTIELEKTIQHLQQELGEIHDLPLSDSPEEQNRLKQKRQALKIEICCLKAIDIEADREVRVENLFTLLDMIPEELEFKNDVRGMLNVLNPIESSMPRWLKVETTETWEDSLLAGTEVSNSCQRIDGDPNLNKCLLAYILDGKNKLMIVRDAEGRIAARSVLRMLWDRKKGSPVLFMEQTYIRTADPALFGIILKGCEGLAIKMGLPLVASAASYPTGHTYQGCLDALGGPAPFEYVDALRGIQKEGVFTINSGKIIYMPEVRHSLGKDSKQGADAGPSHRAGQGHTGGVARAH